MKAASFSGALAGGEPVCAGDARHAARAYGSTPTAWRIRRRPPPSRCRCPPLRFEPRVDIHARNLAEGQADITIRGGIFENTAFQLGAVTVIDPQTGHYFAELPVAPAMLTAPDVRTGPCARARRVQRHRRGRLQYGWRPIRTAGLRDAWRSASSICGAAKFIRESHAPRRSEWIPFRRGRRARAFRVRRLDCRLANTSSIGPISGFSTRRRIRRPISSPAIRESGSAGRTCTRLSIRTKPRICRPRCSR